MNNKLTFEEFLAKRKPMQSIEAALENEIHYAINQFTKHKDEEICELKKKIEELENVINSACDEEPYSFSSYCSGLIYNHDKEIEEIKKKLEKADGVIKFYADKNNWEAIAGHTKFMSNLKVDDCAFLNCGGGMARAYLKENGDE